MLAVVKKRRTKNALFEVKGNIPLDVLDYLKNKFGKDIRIVKDDEELLNVFETQWYKEVKQTITPGETLRIHKENLGISQAELGKKIGKFTRQKISDMENGKRSISKEVAKTLSLIFEVPVDRFI